MLSRNLRNKLVEMANKAYINSLSGKPELNYYKVIEKEQKQYDDFNPRDKYNDELKNNVIDNIVENIRNLDISKFSHKFKSKEQRKFIQDNFQELKKKSFFKQAKRSLLDKCREKFGVESYSTTLQYSGMYTEEGNRDLITNSDKVIHLFCDYEDRFELASNVINEVINNDVNAIVSVAKADIDKSCGITIYSKNEDLDSVTNVVTNVYNSNPKLFDTERKENILADFSTGIMHIQDSSRIEGYVSPDKVKSKIFDKALELTLLEKSRDLNLKNIAIADNGSSLTIDQLVAKEAEKVMYEASGRIVTDNQRIVASGIRNDFINYCKNGKFEKITDKSEEIRMAKNTFNDPESIKGYLLTAENQIRMKDSEEFDLRLCANFECLAVKAGINPEDPSRNLTEEEAKEYGVDLSKVRTSKDLEGILDISVDEIKFEREPYENEIKAQMEIEKAEEKLKDDKSKYFEEMVVTESIIMTDADKVIDDLNSEFSQVSREIEQNTTYAYQVESSSQSKDKPRFRTAYKQPEDRKKRTKTIQYVNRDLKTGSISDRYIVDVGRDTTTVRHNREWVTSERTDLILSDNNIRMNPTIESNARMLASRKKELIFVENLTGDHRTKKISADEVMTEPKNDVVFNMTSMSQKSYRIQIDGLNVNIMKEGEELHKMSLEEFLEVNGIEDKSSDARKIMEDITSNGHINYTAINNANQKLTLSSGIGSIEEEKSMMHVGAEVNDYSIKTDFDSVEVLDSLGNTISIESRNDFLERNGLDEFATNEDMLMKFAESGEMRFSDYDGTDVSDKVNDLCYETHNELEVENDSELYPLEDENEQKIDDNEQDNDDLGL